jgi:hypothetical protein
VLSGSCVALLAYYNCVKSVDRPKTMRFVFSKTVGWIAMKFRESDEQIIRAPLIEQDLCPIRTAKANSVTATSWPLVFFSARPSNANVRTFGVEILNNHSQSVSCNALTGFYHRPLTDRNQIFVTRFDELQM